MAPGTPSQETFGDFLRMIRVYCGLEAQQLAASAGVSNATITYYEQKRGVLSPRNLERIITALQQKLDEKMAMRGFESVVIWDYALHLWLESNGIRNSPTPERPPLPLQKELILSIVQEDL